jgi:hypothetical protein
MVTAVGRLKNEEKQALREASGKNYQQNKFLT